MDQTQDIHWPTLVGNMTNDMYEQQAETYQVDSDRVMNTGLKRELQLCPNRSEERRVGKEC